MATEIDAQIQSIAAEWEDLADRAKAVPWLRPGWVAPWYRAFGRGRLELLTVRRSGRLDAIMPLLRRRWELLSTSNYHTPAFDLLAADTDAAAELASELVARAPSRTALYFLPSPGIGLDQLTRAAQNAGYRAVARLLERMPYVPLGRDWRDYQTERSSKLLRELRRRRRRLEEEGHVELTVTDGTETLAEPLEEMFRVEAAGWKGQRGSAVGVNPATRTFYHEIARWAGARGWLRIAHLRLDGRSLATDFAIEANGVHYLLKTGYDEEYSRFGPGMLIRYEMLQRAFQLPLRSYEFLGHDTAWKLNWTNSVRDQYLLQLFRSSPLGVLRYAAMAYGRPVAKRLLATLGR
jgi:CelD/BcsL family acetyltransferase involved in cellulose biosynthesis